MRNHRPEDEASRPGGEIPERLKRETKTCDSSILRRGDRNSTRPVRRYALLRAMYGPTVVDLAGYVARTRARLDTDLLLENPDQQAQARAWGEAS